MSQRGMVEARIANLKDGQKRSDAPGGAPAAITQRDAARSVGVGIGQKRHAALLAEDSVRTPRTLPDPSGCDKGV